ncbi:MAG: Rossmann-like domain-containing protein [Gammaproteobacteria bacterium]
MSSDPNHIYELLLDNCSTDAVVDNLMIGLVWTLCRSSDHATGLAMSPAIPTRTLSWSGSLKGKPVTDLAAWILEWDPYQSAVAMAAINSCLNNRPLPDSVIVEHDGEQANLAVFDYFLPALQDKKVVVIGHYPGIERYGERMQLSVLEKQPVAGDLPDAACEFLLPQADWVFLTASSIPNKTFPRLAELAGSAKTVLMGPTVPWLPHLHEFGIDYLAGVEITGPDNLYHTAAQGGGVRIFSQGLRYRIAELTPFTCMKWLKQQIADCAAEKSRLTCEMEIWYSAGKNKRFPKYRLLEQTGQRLSRLDSGYKTLWDRHGEPAKIMN